MAGDRLAATVYAARCRGGHKRTRGRAKKDVKGDRGRRLLCNMFSMFHNIRLINIHVECARGRAPSSLPVTQLAEGPRVRQLYIGRLLHEHVLHPRPANEPITCVIFSHSKRGHHQHVCRASVLLERRGYQDHRSIPA